MSLLEILLVKLVVLLPFQNSVLLVLRNLKNTAFLLCLLPGFQLNGVEYLLPNDGLQLERKGLLYPALYGSFRGRHLVAPETFEDPI